MESRKNILVILGAVIALAAIFVFAQNGALSDNDQTAQVSDTLQTETMFPEGLVVEDTVIGTGRAVQKGDTVRVHYKGTLENGSIFDESRPRGDKFEFTVGSGQVIRGWDEGLVGMQENGTRTLVIPPPLAYGNGDIPQLAEATLTFVIDELEFVN